MGANIIEYGGVSSTGGRGPAVSSDCSSTSTPSDTTRSPQSFVPYNCRDWFQAVQPGIHNPMVDTYLGTTCNYMWIPDGFLRSGGFAGGGDSGALGCAAGNIDNPMNGCDIAYAQRTCTGAKAIDQPATDNNGQHSNRISGEFEISVTMNGADQTLGWEYQTYGGQEYFQFAQTLSVSSGVVSVSLGPGAVIPFKGNVFAAIQGLARVLNVTPAQLPMPYRGITARTPLNKAAC